MKKIISLLVIALLTLTTINVNADYKEAEIHKLYINDNFIISAQKIFISWENSEILYFHTMNDAEFWKDWIKFYKYENWNIIEIKEEEMKWTNWLEDDITSVKDKHLKKQSFCNNKNECLENIYIDWKLYITYPLRTITTQWLSKRTLYIDYEDNLVKYHKVFIFEDKKIEPTPIQETPKTTQANPQLDKILAPFFEKTDKKWDEIAQKTYKTLISKIDILLKKRLSVKNKNTLSYLKEKVQEKIK